MNFLISLLASFPVAVAEVVTEPSSFDWTTLVNYGALGTCLVYFIYKDNKTSKQLIDAVTDLKEVLTVVKELIFKKGD